MLTGFIDHWVPSHPDISRFWATPFDKLRPMLDDLLERFAINHFTFYTKWYSNGVKSSLPFLVNHPDAMNTITDNEWGRRLIDYFHAHGITVGAMLQCYTFSGRKIPPEAVFFETSAAESMTWFGEPGQVDIVNPAWPEYPQHLELMLDEHLRLFPGLDAFWLEFEGLAWLPPGLALGKLGLDNVNPSHPLPVKSENIYRLTHPGPGTIEGRWIWQPEVESVLRRALECNLLAAENVFQRHAYHGLRGVVYNAMGYETTYMAKCLPNKNWWLMPWYYWGWNRASLQESVWQPQIEFCRKLFLDLKRQGRHVCYCGNATLPTCTPELMGTMMDLCDEAQLDGYLGMGNFLPGLGLRWHGATADTLAAARRVYESNRLFSTQ